MRVHKHPEKLILASASPRRSELLNRMGLVFEVEAANVEEENSSDCGPEDMVIQNACLKANAVAGEYSNALILGADTTVVIDDLILGKPGNMDSARAILRHLSGREHCVYTAVALIWKHGCIQESFVDSSLVTFKKLNEDHIKAYFDIVNPLDKAGAYGIQQGREMIIKSVKGSVENVMGLPIQQLDSWLKKHQFDFSTSTF